MPHNMPCIPFRLNIAYGVRSWAMRAYYLYEMLNAKLSP
jgi:hypothetical protein